MALVWSIPPHPPPAAAAQKLKEQKELEQEKTFAMVIHYCVDFQTTAARFFPFWLLNIPMSSFLSKRSHVCGRSAHRGRIFLLKWILRTI